MDVMEIGWELWGELYWPKIMSSAAFW